MSSAVNRFIRCCADSKVLIPSEYSGMELLINVSSPSEDNDFAHRENRLLQLKKTVQSDLEKTRYPKRQWVKSKTTTTGTPIIDVLIIGGGQSGLAAAFGLLREQVDNIVIVDKEPRGKAGPWRNFARMPVLRTPKYLSGIDFGIPSLTFESWYVAKKSQESHDALDFIPTETWAEYLDWYRDVLNLPVKWDTQVQSISWMREQNCFEVFCDSQTQKQTLFARKIILATGIDGCGAWSVPTEIEAALPSRRYAHTSEIIDFDRLSGKKIGVLGAAASAFDNAILAAKAHAESVTILSRRKRIPTINPYRWAEFAGFLSHHADLSEEMKWKFAQYFVGLGQLPPKGTFDSAMALKNIYLKTGFRCDEIRDTERYIQIRSGTRVYEFDFLIVATGIATSLKSRKELGDFVEHIALWKDRPIAQADGVNSDLLEHPYLGPNYEFQERTSGSAPYLSSIFCYNFGTLPSLGLSGGSISGLKYSLRRLCHGVTRQLYVEDAAYYFETLQDFDLKEFMWSPPCEEGSAF